MPGAALADWPISYAELEPYYTKAEWELGVSGRPGSTPRSRRGAARIRCRRCRSSRPACSPSAPRRKLGWTASPAPMAILSQPYGGRAGCAQCGFCEGFGCEMQAKSSSLVTVIPVAVRTGHCEIRPDSYVRKIELDRRGRATGAMYFDDADGSTSSAPARWSCAPTAPKRRACS